MIIKLVYLLLLLISVGKTISHGVFLVKNKEKGAVFLFLLSALLVIIPITNVILNVIF